MLLTSTLTEKCGDWRLRAWLNPIFQICTIACNVAEFSLFRSFVTSLVNSLVPSTFSSINRSNYWQWLLWVTDHNKMDWLTPIGKLAKYTWEKSLLYNKKRLRYKKWKLYYWRFSNGPSHKNKIFKRRAFLWYRFVVWVYQVTHNENQGSVLYNNSKDAFHQNEVKSRIF